MLEDVFLHRRQRLLRSLPDNSAVLLSKATDIQYFTGFDTFLEPTEREVLAYLDHALSVVFIPPLTVAHRLTSTKVIPDRSEASIAKTIVSFYEKNSCNSIYVDMASLFASEYVSFKKLLGEKVTAVDRSEIWKLRSIKDSREVSSILVAVASAEKSFAQLRSEMQVGMTEIEVANLLDSLMRKNGSKTPAFPSIVAFGAHSALPHYQPGSTVLQAEMPVLIDFGTTHQGYRSDTTRTFWFGTNPDPEFLKIEKAVMVGFTQAKALLDSSKPITAADLDLAARGAITQAGYGEYFTHTTGHGLGLDIHEPPSLNSRNQQLIERNMAITIEPGIYLPGRFGYRHEDTLIVTKNNNLLPT